MSFQHWLYDKLAKSYVKNAQRELRSAASNLCKARDYAPEQAVDINFILDYKIYPAVHRADTILERFEEKHASKDSG